MPNIFSYQISVTKDMWKPQSAATGYVYSAEIAAEGITDNNNGHIDFDIQSISICAEAEVAPSGEARDGKIILYAKKVPSAAISGICLFY